MPLKDKSDRGPVGVLPYRRPPLSGLYRLRYRPPVSVTSASSYAPLSTTPDTEAEENVQAAKCTAASENPLPSFQGELNPSASAEERRRQLHTQIMHSRSLEDGNVDLFALYSICDAEPVPCAQCSLHMDTTLKTCSYRLRETYTLLSNSKTQQHINQIQGKEEGAVSAPPQSSAHGGSTLLTQLQEGWYAFLFPMSECGRLKDNLLICVNDTLFAGDVAECDFDNGGVLRPLQKTAPFPHASSLVSSRPPYGTTPFGLPQPTKAPAEGGQQGTKASTDATSPHYRTKPLFYYVVSPIVIHSGKPGAEDGVAPTEVVITISWRSYPSAQLSSQARQRSKFTLLYSYYCSPRAPDTLTCRAQFPTDARLRLVRSPNCDGPVQLKSEVTEHSAKLCVETVDGSTLEAHRHPRDYIFQICFYFGNYTGLMEETSWFAALIVAAAFLILLWFFLTKDLVI
ncbi:hypothetical protein ABB37_03476 [Leptomonas pyrrhocoris]|uniref:Transmembrane protein n=1 Tax=Leptomonas pyrrhocoris TaxID=157538 RepID=A0A0M9G4R8_LEPPY|nr:hypothetical protein ABB37_03476 [Leptomonas pyrrhocoris]KPA82400.1 hypothetical protein ABB37_03476 [Leptomonas pyrrhocoris]|eukprot:XP_015660839.1 hypothetical protein ABB37_03476 [Leptomonas pyrrhocoris]